MSVENILILTVGGSHQPLLRSIEQNRPDFVHFLCSDDSEQAKGSYVQVIGEGKVLKSDPKLTNPDLPNLVKLARLQEGQYEVHKIKHFDNLNECYRVALQLIEQLHEEHPEATLIVDYTGGTKSMTAGLVAAALDDGRCDIQLVTGLRVDLNRVLDRTELVRPVRVWDLQASRRMRTAQEQLIARFDYAGAARLLEETARRHASEATIEKLQRWLTLCRAFDAWDRFDHETARDLLKPYKADFEPYVKFLGLFLGGQGHGFELVEDLIRNAERRAVQGRYDDAVGRLYRALELMAQLWLQERHEIDTGNVQLPQVPEHLRPQLEKERDERGIIKIGLKQAWDLIAAFPNDPLGDAFLKEEDRLLGFLQLRNQSLFAHGTRPISREDYQQHTPHVMTFLNEAMGRAIHILGRRRIASLPQFPTKWG
jgi:hypothetical protein